MIFKVDLFIVYKILYSQENGGGSKKISKQEFENARQNSKPTDIYGPTGLNLTVPGGTNYTENAIRIPGVVNVISAKGGYHDDQFNQCLTGGAQ